MSKNKKLDNSESIFMTGPDLMKAYKKGRRIFHYVHIEKAKLAGVNLTGASFFCATLRNADLSNSILTSTQLKGADLTGANLQGASINASDLIDTNFSEANLSEIDFTGASLARAICTNADLRSAYFGNATLASINLNGANLEHVSLSSSYLDDMDVRPFCNARRIKHISPSYVDARTVMRSYTHPKLKKFLVGCGVPEIFAEYMIDCAQALGEPLMKKLMQSTFISYGGPDEAFARKLYDTLKAHNVIVFFFPETARIGERINNEVFQKIQEQDRVILICSKNSLNRTGVINEIQETLDREARDGGATYLLPIMLDDYVLTEWKNIQPVLAERISRRIIADFRKAKRSKAEFSKAFDRLVDALKIKQVESPEDVIRG